MGICVFETQAMPEASSRLQRRKYAQISPSAEGSQHGLGDRKADDRIRTGDLFITRVRFTPPRCPVRPSDRVATHIHATRRRLTQLQLDTSLDTRAGDLTPRSTIRAFKAE
jgi:hypothetical protein